MKFNQCQKDIIKYVIAYETSEVSLTPCIEVFGEIFKEKYSNLDIEENTRALVSSGILTPYSFHAYIRLTETFITSLDYKLFKENKI